MARQRHHQVAVALLQRHYKDAMAPRNWHYSATTWVQKIFFRSFFDLFKAYGLSLWVELSRFRLNSKSSNLKLN
ncbi:hypothetical protein TorRG33x02_340430 [Trema orientale]|uniref:Uncharacterized protein n=1 Tax=Trema orientale TaxID=63057 RepID=A0A2P5AV23_TREOI|nr:hypothetical protein TorRG33x02_340430 [Trema orientale]